MKHHKPTTKAHGRHDDDDDRPRGRRPRRHRPTAEEIARAKEAREEQARAAEQEREALLAFRSERDAAINGLLSRLEDETRDDGAADGTPQGMINPLGQAAKVISPVDPKRVHPVYGTLKPHNGTDMVPADGTTESPVLAAADGFILYKGAFSKDAGQTVLIYHPRGPDGPYITGYMHLKEGSLTALALGSPVAQGDTIGQMGATGVGTGPHLHFVVRKLNPRPEDMPLLEPSSSKALDDGGVAAQATAPIDPARSFSSYTVIRPTINGVLYAADNQTIDWIAPKPKAAKQEQPPITLPPSVMGGEPCDAPFGLCALPSLAPIKQR